MSLSDQILSEGIAALQAENLDVAEDRFNFLLNKNPTNPDLLFYSGTCMMRRGWHGAGEAMMRSALKKDPNATAAWNNLGYLLKVQNKDSEAIQAFHRAIKTFPKDANRKELAGVYANLGSCFVNYGQPRRAIEYMNKALEIEPDNPRSMWNKALAHLELGEWEEGWKLYDAGFRGDDKRKDKKYGDAKVWDGTPDQSVVVYGEQGIGDEILFSSMIPDMAERCKTVILDAHPRLFRIFRASFAHLKNVIVYGTRKQPDPHWIGLHKIDARVAIGSLGKWFRNRDADFPRVAYIKPPGAHKAFITERMPDNGKLNVGIHWKGGYAMTRKDQRSIPLEQFLPILKADCNFYSFQYTPNAAENVAELNAKHGTNLIHDQEIVDDYDLTTEAVSRLDLIISVNTSLVHLAGAMGKEVYTLTPTKCAWRYGVTRDDMIWYPDVSMVRQGNGWEGVIAKIAENLCSRAKSTENRISDYTRKSQITARPAIITPEQSLICASP